MRKVRLPGLMKPSLGARARLMTAGAVALTALCAGILAAPQAASAASLTPIVGLGSTWAQPAIHQSAVAVRQADIVVNYEGVGSTAGRAAFADGLADFGASEIPYGVHDGVNTDNPPTTRGFAYMPDAAGGIALMYNLSINGKQVTNLRLSGAVIARIFTNQITTWNDPAIVADNPGLDLPATPIIPVVRTDGSGATWQFTQWMQATQPSSWIAYCAVVGRSPCTPTSAYPVAPGTAMVGQAGDPGVATYVSSPQANGAIGVTEYQWAVAKDFPVAKVLNAAGYYTAPTPGNVGVSLLSAHINMDSSNPDVYLTEDLSQVYTDTDPRTYELSYYSYMIIPTDLRENFTLNKGFTLGSFGQFLLCEGQSLVDPLGYSALPINLVEAGFDQLRNIPGSQVPATDAAAIAQCHNPTFSTDGTNTLAQFAPMPPACDQQGATQCDAVSAAFTLTASPNPAKLGQPVTLTATVTPPAGAAIPAGSVQFEVGGTAIGPAVALDSSGVATTTTPPFSATGTVDVEAVFTPADPNAFTGAFTTLLVTVQPTVVSGTIPLAVPVPVTGVFTLTIDTSNTVPLVVSGSSATGLTTAIVVSDTRNTFPGWSVLGRSIDFTGSGTAAGASVSCGQLGWMPTGFGPFPQGVTLGAQVNPANPGLCPNPAVLASAPSGLGNGYGTIALGADLTLAIPALQAAGPYSGGLSITAMTSNP